MILRDLLDAWPLAPIGAGVALLLLFGRDPKADEHDLSDYHEPAPDNDPTCRYVLHNDKVSLKPWAAAEDTTGEQALPSEPEDILPPTPPGMNAGSPLYAGMLFDTWHPESPAEVAARVLRDIAAVEQAKAGIRPAASVQQAPSCSHGYSTHKNRAGVTMHPNGKPCTDADMTGAFPVVRAAA